MPLSWAEHFKVIEVFDRISTHCRANIHGGDCSGLPGHVQARIAGEPDSVNRVIDQWNIPRSVPLRYAAYCPCLGIAKLLLDNNAGVNALAGNGRTALGLAEERGAAEAANLLRDYGGLISANV